MRLGLKLAAIGLVILTPKTQLYLSNAYWDTQAVSERPVSVPVAQSDHFNHVAVVAEGKQPKTSSCAAKPLEKGKDAMAIHAMNKGPKGSQG